MFGNVQLLKQYNKILKKKKGEKYTYRYLYSVNLWWYPSLKFHVPLDEFIHSRKILYDVSCHVQRCNFFFCKALCWHILRCINHWLLPLADHKHSSVAVFDLHLSTKKLQSILKYLFSRTLSNITEHHQMFIYLPLSAYPHHMAHHYYHRYSLQCPHPMNMM